MIPYSKHVGFWLLLFAGVCGLVSNIAALFGYSGRYTLALVIGCITMSLVTGAVSYRLANKNRPTAPRQPSSESMKFLSYQNWTKAQRLRWFFTWTGAGLAFALADFVVYQTAIRLFPL